MIHKKVDATVHFILKCHLDGFGSVEGAGAGWGFLKLQHHGRSLRSVPLNKLPHFSGVVHFRYTGISVSLCTCVQSLQTVLGWLLCLLLQSWWCLCLGSPV